MDEKGLKKTCIQAKKRRGGIHQPLYGTWVVDFMLRQDAGRFMLGKYLGDPKIPFSQYSAIYPQNSSQNLQILPKIFNSFSKNIKKPLFIICTLLYFSSNQNLSSKKIGPIALHGFKDTIIVNCPSTSNHYLCIGLRVQMQITFFFV